MSNDNPFFHPESVLNSAPPSAGYVPTYVPAPRMSVMALFSLLSAIASPLLICLCIPSMVTSFISILLGHIALYRISRSPATMGGRWMALVGIVISYPMLFLSVSLFVWWCNLPKPTEARMAAASAEKTGLDMAESKIFTDNQGIAHGNTPEAEALARKFATNMKALREEFFTKRSKPTVSLSGEEFITYCELRPGKCAFVVHVPSYRKFNDDAKETLAELAWTVAQRTVAGTLDEGDELGVGLKGTFLYGAVMVGKVGATEDDAGLYSNTTNRENLFPFFEPLKQPLPPVAPPIDLGEPAKPQAEPKPAESSTDDTTPVKPAPNEEAAP